jgi:LysM repeat protein
MKKRTSKSWKRKGHCAWLSVIRYMLNCISDSTPAKSLVRRICRWQNFALMNVGATFLAISSFVLCTGSAQTPAPDAAKLPEAAQLEALAKKIEEQNVKIDALSQEILKLEQQLSHVRPGVMIGEGAPGPATAAAPAGSASHPPVAGNTHTVSRGETLTSIAKMYKVTVDELQQANHIEDGRKLQAGQTIVIPTPSPAGPASSSPE